MAAHKILVVDDNRDFRGNLRHQLETWGYQVLEAEDKAEEVKTALEELPDLLLLDYHMPYGRGIQVANTALARCPGMHVLFIATGFELSVLKEIAPTDTHFMEKPFEMEDLHRNITQLLH